MTEHEALPYEDLPAWPEDGYEDDAAWYDYPAAAAPVREAPPWYRSPAVLLTLIGLAAAVLVVATALLVTGRISDEMPAAPGAESRTSVPVPPTRASRTEPTTTVPPDTGTAPTPTAGQTTEPGSEPGREPGIEAAPGPAGPAPSASPPSDSPSRSPQGPRINVTRTPMSFSPGEVG